MWDVLAFVGFNWELLEGRDFCLFCYYPFLHTPQSAWDVAGISGL